CEADQIEGVVCNGLFLHHDINIFKNLKYIQLTSAGLDRVPVEKIEKRGITLRNARGVYSIPMAEFAVAGVLSLYKQSRFFYKMQEQHLWEKNRGVLELFGKTVCIVGCGSVGNECAKRFSAFGCHILGVDLYPREDGCYEAMRGFESLQECLSESDVVVLTLPLTEQTKRLFDDKVFAAMKTGSVLVNIARGAIVDCEALKNALESRLGGAVLDVFEEEPLAQNSYLWDMKNVIVTPHNSFVGDGNGERLFDLIIRNLEEYNENYCCRTQK
ncbi:MAG: hydroxyacid dehydrogenase, partial [Clostridia bacterium]|nr:hydroxyacid dehydrogenase [Clostridia bacterium]